MNYEVHIEQQYSEFSPNYSENVENYEIDCWSMTSFDKGLLKNELFKANILSEFEQLVATR